MQEEAKNSQAEIDKANSEFWNELCGSNTAKELGVTDNSPESLKKFDDWYMGYYPYLTKNVPIHSFANKRVLEVGLGYGTLSQKIAESGADYLGIDIALGPVSMVRYRLEQAGLPGVALQRNFLENHLEDESFDAVVAIGCFHHTGQTQRCIDETFRLLKPLGTAYLMVYNRFSHRRWTRERETFLNELVDEEFERTQFGNVTERERAENDFNSEGDAAPETTFLSQREFEKHLRAFSRVKIQKENMDEDNGLGMDRMDVLDTWGKVSGLDLYAWAQKGIRHSSSE